MGKEVIVSLLGAVVGGGLTILGQYIHHRIVTDRIRKRDEGRRKLLKQMLDNPKFEWRKLDTLAHVIGASGDKTVRLLIDIGARGSEKGDGKWGYVRDHPLPEAE